MAEARTAGAGPEWATVVLIAACYGLWGGALFWLSAWLPVAAWGLLVATIVLQSSLSHEALHGHPFRAVGLNEALVALPIGLLIPYRRFRDLHMAHHRDASLTDPYDDPESNYLDPAVWAGLRAGQRAVFRANNTLLGRMLIGPALGQLRFMAAEVRLLARGARPVRVAWALHLPGVAVVLMLVMASPMPVWAYLGAAYAGMGVLKIRTFLEHQAHADAEARTVIIEDRGPLAFLFLFNNLHVVHHLHPGAPWYRLPGLYRRGRAGYVARNGGYVFRSYGDVMRRYLVRAKDPVPHPLWSPR